MEPLTQDNATRLGEVVETSTTAFVAQCYEPYGAFQPTCDKLDSDETLGANMRRRFTATLWQEGNWHVAQCLEVDVASQGETEEEALANLEEALALHFEEPRATALPTVRQVEVEVSAS
ncbi:MAG: HicB family protein [Dehalococcoidia bacterium]|nr:HicB family protein [Dehalococcoidia bacterium]